jgi:hypothetical protein
MLVLIGIQTGGFAFAAPSHGLDEFTTTGTWVAPKGVTAVLVEAWGAGGGGGGAYYVDPQVGIGNEASSGGGGAYARQWVEVKPHKSYIIGIGVGGAGGAGGGSGVAGQDGKAGTDTVVIAPDDRTLLRVGGGAGGHGAVVGPPFGINAPGVPGGKVVPNRTLSIAGPDSQERSNASGIIGSYPSNGAGTGGSYGPSNALPSDGHAGSPGRALLTW